MQSRFQNIGRVGRFICRRAFIALLTTVRKNCKVSILHLAVSDTPWRTISGHHRSFLPESLLVRIVLDATVAHLIAES
jgi:hypothetical protein